MSSVNIWCLDDLLCVTIYFYWICQFDNNKTPPCGLFVCVWIPRLRQAVAQSESEERTLVHCRLRLQRSTEVKANALYVDEVVCGQHRGSIVIRKFWKWQDTFQSISVVEFQLDYKKKVLNVFLSASLSIHTPSSVLTKGLSYKVVFLEWHLFSHTLA